MRKYEFILAGKSYEVINDIINKLGKSLIKDNNLKYISSNARFLEDNLEITVFYKKVITEYIYDIGSEIFIIKYKDLKI